MKVMAINSSPRSKKQSKTHIMLDPLVLGMREVGADVEVVELRKVNIHFCVGCYACWTKTPGQCIHKDIMSEELFPKWQASDIAVYAFPLYNDGINAAMKVFIERTLPSYEPFLLRKNNRTYHPLRGHHPAIVILSVAGMPEDANFDLLSSHVNYLFRKSGKKLLAEIYRPGAELLAHPLFEGKRKEIIEALQLAGKELILKGEISVGTNSRIRQPLGEPDDLNEMGNQFWNLCIDQKSTPKELVEKLRASS